MAVAQSDIVNIAPELAGLSAGEFTVAIADALLQLDSLVWGTQYIDQATKLLAAHILSVNHPELTKSAKEDRIPTYQKVPAAGAYNDSRFGVQYWRLRRQVVGPFHFLV